jgi:hypothetical protein
VKPFRVLALAALFVGMASAASAVGTLPRFTSRGDAPLTVAEDSAMRAWFLQQHEVRSHFGTDRFSIQRMGAQEEKNPDGSPFRRVVAHVRNYSTGMVTRLTARLDDNSLEVVDIGYGAMQSSPAEIDRALAIIKSDPRLKSLNDNLMLTLRGGFVVRAEDPADPCAREMCVQFGYMEPNFDTRNRRMVIVNMSREKVVNIDYETPPPGANRARMTVEGQ